MNLPKREIVRIISKAGGKNLIGIVDADKTHKSGLVAVIIISRIARKNKSALSDANLDGMAA
ncbi:MAG: hypothetical protein ACU88J_11275 [Gammaproteobacteria bacterium]